MRPLASAQRFVVAHMIGQPTGVSALEPIDVTPGSCDAIDVSDPSTRASIGEASTVRQLCP